MLVAEHTLDPCAHHGAGFVGRFLTLGQGRRIDDLTAHGKVAALLEIRVKLVEQPLDRPGCGQSFALEPQHLGIGNRILQPEANEPYERQPVAQLGSGPNKRIPIALGV